MYVGRFAPSPTGPLHFGSLVAALASWLDARAAGGRWLVRLEDLDRRREQPGAAAAILRTLEQLGLHWDGEVLYQSAREAAYRAALEALARRGHTYLCGCSRKEIADSILGPDGASVYPGTCRAGVPAGKAARALRVRTGGDPVRFIDRLQGMVEQSVEREVGDFVVLRADGLVAYQLAVVVDDAEQRITDVVRGADLLDSTPRQIHLQRLLGYGEPRYLHVPVAINEAGEKLAKQTGAAAIDAGEPARVLRRALAFLRQPQPDCGEDPRELLAQALGHWNPALIPPRRAEPASR
jgi:glutamyl-Q tRNA(Asp) synthetase